MFKSTTSIVILKGFQSDYVFYFAGKDNNSETNFIFVDYEVAIII